MLYPLRLYWDTLVSGASITIRISLLAFIVGLMLSFFLFAGRTSTSAILRVPSLALIEAGKGIPALVIMFWIYLCLPLLAQIRVSAETAAVGALAFNYSVNVAEVLRSTWVAVSRDLRGGLAFNGIPRTSSVAFFEGPFLLSAALPGVLAQFSATLKLSAVAAFIGVPEIFHSTQSVIQQTYLPVVLYTALAIFYLTIVVLLTLIEGFLRKRFVIGSLA